MRIRFTLEGKENGFEIESEDLSELVYKITETITSKATESGLKIKNEQFLISAICEAVCNDAYSEEINLGELGGE